MLRSVPFGAQGNEVYGGGEKSAGIFLHRSGDDATVKGEEQFFLGDCDASFGIGSCSRPYGLCVTGFVSSRNYEIHLETHFCFLLFSCRPGPWYCPSIWSKNCYLAWRLT